MNEKKTLSEDELKIVSGGSDCINRDELESKIGKVVNFRCNSEGINCTVKIIKIDVVYRSENHSRMLVYVYATDEASYEELYKKRYISNILCFWNCDGVNPQKSGLGYGKNGFRISITESDDVYFYGN